MPKITKRVRKFQESKQKMKTMPNAPKNTSPNAADTEIRKLMENRGVPRKKAK